MTIYDWASGSPVKLPDPGTLPTGDGFYPYVAWREGGEDFFFRVEDLIRDLDRRRGRWEFRSSDAVRCSQRSCEPRIQSRSGGPTARPPRRR